MTDPRLHPSLERALEAALGPVRVEREARVGGGCIHESKRLETSRGPLFVKRSDPRDPPLFAAEAAGLRALAAGAPALAIPEVITAVDATANEPGWLVLSWLDTSRPPAADHDERLGRGLAELHRTTESTFGFACDTFCGGTRQPNPRVESWIDFYRDHRILELVRVLVADGAFASADTALFDRLATRLPELLPADGERPALIHGDLWSGNAVVADGAPGLVDPAASFSHREAELGMMTLFGGFSARTFAAYEEAFPLPAGHVERRPLYQLFHVLNHGVLFGGGYLEQARRIARRFAG